MPDGTSPVPPPAGGTAAVSPTQEYTINLSAGEFVRVGQVGDLTVYHSFDTAGKQWLSAVNTATGEFSATLLNYGSSDVPVNQPTFVPDAARWNLVWMPDTGSWVTARPGTVFAGPVKGQVNGLWNVVYLSGTANTGIRSVPGPMTQGPVPGGTGLTVKPGLGGRGYDVTGPGGTLIVTPSIFNDGSTHYMLIPIGGGAQRWTTPPTKLPPNMDPKPPAPPGAPPGTIVVPPRPVVPVLPPIPPGPPPT